MKPTLNRNPHLVYVLEIQGGPIGMVGGVTSREAGQLRREHWFVDELRSRRDDQGHPIWDGETPFTVRVAEEAEIDW